MSYVGVYRQAVREARARLEAQSAVYRAERTATEASDLRAGNVKWWHAVWHTLPEAKALAGA